MKIRLSLTASIAIFLIGLFLVAAATLRLVRRFDLVVSLQNEGAAFIVVLLFVSTGWILIQLGIRSMSRTPPDPTRHIFTDWTLYPLGIFWILLSLFVVIAGSMYGLIPLTIGVLVLVYAYMRPATRDPKPFIRFEVPIENPNLWTQLLIGNKVHYTLYGGYLFAWFFPWEILSHIPLQQEFVAHLIPYFPGLGALRDKAANPEFAVGLVSFVVSISPATILITIARSQTADRVLTGDYPVTYAWKLLLLSLAALPIFIWAYIGVPDGDTALQNLMKNSELAISVQQVTYIWILNVVLMLILSLSKAMYFYYRKGVKV